MIGHSHIVSRPTSYTCKKETGIVLRCTENGNEPIMSERFMGHLIETRGVYQVWDSTDRKLCQQDVEQAVGKNTQITSLSRSWLFKLGY